MAKLFYIQRLQNYVGNSIVWWAEGNCGYCCDIQKARAFTGKEARKICPGRGRYARRSRTFRMWPKDYIDERISQHIDMQDCDWEQALKG